MTEACRRGCSCRRTPDRASRHCSRARGIVVAVGLREQVAGAGEQQSVADVLVALKARRVAVDAGHAAADEELPVGQLEQAARRIVGARLETLAAGCAGVCGAGGGVPAWASARCGAAAAPTRRSANMNRDSRRMFRLPVYRMKNWPDGWFDPWMFEWQFTHDRPNMRLLLLVVIVVVVVERRRMLGGDVAALAEHRHADVQHAIVRGAVRVVAGRAALAHRRVLEQHRSTHLRVTARAQLSSTELPVFRALTLLIEPCGLWQDSTTSCPREPACARPRARFSRPAGDGTSHTAASRSP